jgi:hypothetical protein
VLGARREHNLGQKPAAQFEAVQLACSAGIETLTRAMSEDRLAATQYRTDVRREMKEQSATLHELVGELKAFKTDMAQ